MQAVVVGPLREAQYRAGCRRAAAALQLSSGALFSLQTSHSVQRRQVAAAAEPSSVPPAASGGSGSGDGSSGGASQAAPVVQIEYRGRALQAQRGATLRTALLEAGVTPHNGRATLMNCRGLGTCGTCAVDVQGSVEPAEWTAQERLRLNFPPHAPPGNRRLRLACQVACQEDVRVIKRDGFWGQGERILGDVACSPAAAAGSNRGSDDAAAGSVMPLGQLEFVLDRRRRQQQQQQQQR